VSVAGAASIGSVWGWISGWYLFPVSWPPSGAGLTLLGIASIAALGFAMQGADVLWPALASSVAGMGLNVAWRNQLANQRAAKSPAEGEEHRA